MRVLSLYWERLWKYVLTFTLGILVGGSATVVLAWRSCTVQIQQVHTAHAQLASFAVSEARGAGEYTSAKILAHLSTLYDPDRVVGYMNLADLYELDGDRKREYEALLNAKTAIERGGYALYPGDEMEDIVERDLTRVNARLAELEASAAATDGVVEETELGHGTRKN